LRPHRRRDVDATDFTQIRQKKALLKYDQPNPTRRSSWADPCTRLDTQLASRDVNTRHVTSTSVERRRKSTLTSRAPPTPTTCRVRARVGWGSPPSQKLNSFLPNFRIYRPRPSTIVPDTNNVQFVFDAVTDVIIKNNLKQLCELMASILPRLLGSSRFWLKL